MCHCFPRILMNTEDLFTQATVPQSTGVNVQATAVPSAVSGSSSGSGSGSGSGSNTSGAIKGSVGTAAGFLTAVMSLFFTLA